MAFNQLRWLDHARIENHAGAMRHQVNMRRFNPGRRAQRLFHMMLAGAQLMPRNRHRNGFRRDSSH